MQLYKNLSGHSGVKAYESNKDAIIVEFTTGGSYLYTHNSAGAAHVENMKQLARLGKGLNTYINQNTHLAYAKDLAVSKKG
ncbi:MAG: hypothetical protein WAT67_11335 [Candidatus Contendobacter sp.]